MIERRLLSSAFLTPALLILLFGSGTPALAGSRQVDLGKMGREFEKIAAKISPSVVDILIQEQVVEKTEGKTAALEQTRRFRCSGVISSKNGEVITLLKNGLPQPEEGGEIVMQVTLSDGTSYGARLTAIDRVTGVALLRIVDPPRKLSPVFASNRVKNGSLVVAVGSSYGMHNSFKFGMVSSVKRRVRSKAFSFPRAIQTDIPAEAGLVGGMLANTSGEMVGLLAFSYSPSQGRAPRPGHPAHGTRGSGSSMARGSLMAIPSDLLLRITSELRRDGKVSRGVMQVSFRYRTHMELKSLGIHIHQPGAQVLWVGAGGAAEKAGLRVGDIVTQVGDHRIKTETDLSWFSEQVEYGKIDAELIVHVYRCTKEFKGYRQLTIKVEGRPSTMRSLPGRDLRE